MKDIPDQSIDMILCDPPYGTTVMKWDAVIPFDPMWEQLNRIIKPHGAIVLHAAQPFTSALIMSNVEMFKYSLVWKKSRICHFAQAPYRFLTEHEDICIFSFAGTSKNARNRMTFNPQGLTDCNIEMQGLGHREARPSKIKQANYIQTKTGYPKSILEFKSDHLTVHPTQKPISLAEYLIKTYTNGGGTVLDFTAGSGTTGIACVNTNRKFIGIELDKKYYDIAVNRIQSAQVQPRLIA